jgi:hypothetical protein
MKVLVCCTLVALVALSGSSRSHSLRSAEGRAGSAQKELVGAWRPVSLESPGPDGKLNPVTDIKGMLLYTSDGHMSVQLLYPKSASDLTNDYVKDGYEASFGSYDVDEAKHTVTHHVQGSITEGLVGKDLPRAYQLSGKRLIIKSTRAEER